MQFGVSVFVYCSVHRGETDDDSEILAEHTGKIKIERHIQSLGEQGFQWTYVLLSYAITASLTYGA